MDRRHTPRAGEKYLDFKNKPYQVLCMATNADTREQMVVYQALYGDFACYARPLSKFMERVERGERPDASREYCFELVDRIPDSHSNDWESNNASAKEEQANPVLLEFLDADTLERKYQILKSLRNTITNRLVDDFAVALDLVIPEGEVDVRYQQLLSSVRTMQQYESSRFPR